MKIRFLLEKCEVDFTEKKNFSEAFLTMCEFLKLIRKKSSIVDFAKKKIVKATTILTWNTKLVFKAIPKIFSTPEYNLDVVYQKYSGKSMPSRRGTIKIFQKSWLTGWNSKIFPKPWPSDCGI